MKRSTLFIALGSVVTAFLAFPLSAQTSNFQHAEDGRYELSLAFGLDPAVVTSVGITRWTGVGDRLVGLSLEGTLPVAEVDLHDYRVRAGASLSLVQFGTFHLATQVGLSARGTQNVHFTAHGFGADLAAFLGHYGQRTFAAVELGYDKAVLEHIEHRPFYLANYPDAVDGWYKAPAGTFRFGLTMGASLGRVGLGVRAYVVRSEGWKELMPPLGTTMSLSYRF